MGWGDELMVTGECRKLQIQDRRKIRIVYEKPRPRGHPAWDWNPRIARPWEDGDFQEFRPRTNYLRPYCTEKTAEKWTWRKYGPPRGELYFNSEELEFGEEHKNLIIVEPRIKAGASPNKDWGWTRWNKLAWLLRKKGVIVTQLGADPLPHLEQVEVVKTENMRLAAAVMARARAAVLTEGGLHHVAAAVDTPAVVIYGGYISPQVTGYPEQIDFFTGEGLGCGMRIPCTHCADAMNKISPEAVVEAVMKIR